MATCGLAVNRRVRQGNDLKEETCFVDIVAFGRQAETIGEYMQAVIEGKKAAGMAGEELETLIASMETLSQQYASPLFRVPMTFLEIFPFGLIISLISAALLRNSKFLPAAA